MKLNKKIIALLLTLSIVFSVVMPISLTSNAATSTSDVILEWDFSDVAGNTVNDISGNGNNGTIDGATVANGVATFTGGENEYVRLPANIFDGYSENSVVTIELAISPVVTNDHTTFLHFGESNLNFVVLAIMGNNNLRYATKADAKGNGEITVNSNSSPLTLNATNIVKYVIAPNVTMVYVNNTCVAELTTGKNYFVGNVDSAGALGGKAFWNDPCFNGSIDHFKISVRDIDRSVKPTLEATTDEILGYVNFANAQSTWTNVSAFTGTGVTISDGIATFAGTKLAENDFTSNDNAVVFDSSILASIKDTLTIEMTIRPTTISDHRVIMSIGDGQDFYAIMGLRDTNALKFNEGKTNNNIIAPNEWVTLKYVMNESGSYIYVNNDLYAKTTPISLKRLASSNEPVKFGQRTVPYDDDCFAGDVSEIRITTSEAGRLNFSLQAVNLLTGEDTLTNSSTLTIQYTDATIGTETKPVKLYAKITDTTTNTILYSQQIDTLAVQTSDVYADYGSAGGEGTISGVEIYSDTAGSISFTPGSVVAGKNISNLEVTVWTENGTMSSGMATTTINNKFISNGTPTESGFTATDWMNYIDGSTLLTQINLPGTHDAATQYIDTVTFGLLWNREDYAVNKCQDSSIETQLNMGVRYLDIRADLNNTITKDAAGNITDFGMSHSSFKCKDANGNSLLFSSVIATCKTFLQSHSSECIIMSINDEYMGDYKRSDLLNALHYFVAQEPELFYTQNNEVPTLDDVRGKIVVLRRFPDNSSGESGFMDFFWKDNSDGIKHGMFIQEGNVGSGKRSTAVTLYWVQDYYGEANSVSVSTMSTETKKSKIQSFINTSKVPNQYYINFFSMAYTTSGSYGTTPNGVPEDHAKTINSWFTSNVNLSQTAQHGYLIFDFVSAAVCKKVYEANIFTTTAQVGNTNNNKAVVHYDFAEVENNIVEDTMANGFNGSMLNTEALEFNSIYDMITFNNTGATYGSISVPQGAFSGTGDTATLQVWVKSAVNMNSVLFGAGCNTLDSSNNPNNYFTGTTGGFTFKTTKVGSATETSASSNASDLANQWHLLTYVLNDGTMSVYLDDNTTAIASGAVNANFSDVSGGVFKDSSLLLGASGLFTTSGFIGSMGDFTIYNYAVDTSTIAGTYRDLADEYTYITKVTLSDNIEILASRTPSDSYIDESNTATGSTIWFTLPDDANLEAVPLSLEYDSSAIATISINGETSSFVNGNTYDLSGNVVLTLKSIDDTSSYVKTYNVKVNGIVKKDWSTGTFKEILETGSTPTLSKDDTNLYVGWYTEQGGDILSQAPQAGDIVYDRAIAITNPDLTEQSIRSENKEQGLTKGIRFKATIARDDFYNYLYGVEDYVYENATNFKFGMLMLPEEMLGNNELNINTQYVLDIKGEKVYNQKNTNGDLEFTGCLVNLTENFCDVKLVARAYIAYTFVDEAGNEKVYYIYSEQCTPVTYKEILASFQ